MGPKPRDMGIFARFSLEDRVAIVTGSGSGIGKAIALAFAQAGAHIVVAELDAPTGEATAAEIRALGRRALPMVVDATNSKQVKNSVDKAMAEFGRIDILVNNAGGTRGIARAPFTDVTDDTWNKIVDLNLKAAFLFSKAVSQVMMDQGKGNIINIASTAGLRPHPFFVPYGAAKAGLVNLSLGLAVHLASYHIRVNVIAPGTIANPRGDATDNKDERTRRAGVPLGRAGRVEDIALAAIYLASDASDYVSGITLEVAGGPFMGAKILEEARVSWQTRATKKGSSTH